MSMGDLVDRVRTLPRATYVRAIPYALIAILAIGLPTDLIPNPVFGRPVPVRPIDYLILVVTSALMGLVFAVRPELGPQADDEAALAAAVESSTDTRAMWGGFVSFLAVGCPVCNQAVVALIGTSGALSWWAPVQPLVGLAAIAVLLMALRKRLLTYDLEGCPVP